jgi:hypothetical protein
MIYKGKTFIMHIMLLSLKPKLYYKRECLGASSQETIFFYSKSFRILFF